MKFEYQIVRTRLAERSPEAIEREMNTLGDNGWEMVGAFGNFNENLVFMRSTAPVAVAKKPRAKAEA